MIGYPKRLAYLDACVCIGHEMYHRVTAKVKGMRDHLWADEMMACMTSYQAMQSCGWRDYELICRRHLCDLLIGPVTLNEVAEVVTRRKGPITWLFPDTYYPAKYGCKVVALGSALLELVDWDTLTSLIRAATLPEWIDQINPCHAKNVRILLGFTSEELSVTALQASLASIRRLAAAFIWMGRLNEAIDLLIAALERYPDDLDCRYDLAVCLHRAKRPAEAIVMANVVAEWRPDDMRIHYFLGIVLVEQGDAIGAVKQFTLSSRLSPEHAYSQYRLGLALVLAGNNIAARNAFARAIEIGDEYISNAASTALRQISS